MTTEMTIENLFYAVEQLGQKYDAAVARIEMQETLQGQNVAMIETHDDRLNAQAIVVARRGDQIEGLSDQIADAEAHVGNQSINQRSATLHQAERITTINDRLAIHVTRMDASASMHESAGMMREMDHNRTDQLEARIASHAKQFDQVVERLERLDEKLADETFRIDGQTDDLEVKHGQRLTDIESTLEDTTSTANGAEMDVNDCKMDISNVESKVGSLETELQSLSHTVNFG